MGAFAGRQAEVAEITALLGRVRLVTLSGAEVCALLAALGGVWLPEVCDRLGGLRPAIEPAVARGTRSTSGAATCAGPS